MSTTLGIILNPSAGAITDHSQSAKDIDSYFKSQLYVEEWRAPTTENQYSFYQMDWVNHSASAQQKLISAMGGIQIYNLLIEKPVFYQ